MGLALGLSPFLVWGLTIIGSMIGVFAVALAGDAARAWLVRRRGASTAAGHGRRRLITWMGAGVILWTSILVIVGDLGLRAIHILS